MDINKIIRILTLNDAAAAKTTEWWSIKPV